MISSANRICNNQFSSLYTGRILAQRQILAQTQSQTGTQAQNSKTKSIVAKTGRNLSEMVFAIKQAKAMSFQEKVQNIFQKLTEKTSNSSFPIYN